MEIEETLQIEVSFDEWASWADLTLGELVSMLKERVDAWTPPPPPRAPSTLLKKIGDRLNALLTIPEKEIPAECLVPGGYSHIRMPYIQSQSDKASPLATIGSAFFGCVGFVSCFVVGSQWDSIGLMGLSLVVFVPLGAYIGYVMGEKLTRRLKRKS